MQIGVFAALGNPFATPDYLRALGAAAEERGFHSLWAAEHVVLFDAYGSRYPYAADGRIPAGRRERGGESAASPISARVGTASVSIPRRRPNASLASRCSFASGAGAAARSRSA